MAVYPSWERVRVAEMFVHRPLSFAQTFASGRPDLRTETDFSCPQSLIDPDTQDKHAPVGRIPVLSPIALVAGCIKMKRPVTEMRRPIGMNLVEIYFATPAGPDRNAGMCNMSVASSRFAVAVISLQITRTL